MFHFFKKTSSQHQPSQFAFSPNLFKIDEQARKHHELAISWFNSNYGNLCCGVDLNRGSLFFYNESGRVSFAMNKDDAEQFYALTRLGSPFMSASVAANGFVIFLASLENWNLYAATPGARLEIS
jgi:hypothetical protein